MADDDFRATFLRRHDAVPEKVRVTQIYRHEDSGWKVVHRHGDIIRPDYTND